MTIRQRLKTCAIIPVKELADGKRRLAPALPAPARRKLVLAMLEDVLETLAKLTEIGPCIVVTADPHVATVALGSGLRVLHEQRSTGINDAVSLGLIEAARIGMARALILPADVPLAAAAEFRRILGPAEGGGTDRLVIVPSRNGEGTNALLVPISRVFAPRYGEGSFLRHVSQALSEQRGLEVMHLPGLACDIDHPADLDVLRSQRQGQPRYAFLEDAGAATASPPRQAV